MNLNDLRKQVNTDIDDDLDNDVIDGWLNRALDDLTPYAQYKKSTTINVLTGVSDYTIPTDILDIVVVGQNLRRLPLEDFTSYGYKVIGNTLTLQPVPTEDSTITLIYNAYLPYLVAGADVPVIPQNFHNLLVMYAIGKFKYQDEELSFKDNAMADYEAKKGLFIRYVNRQNAPKKIRDVYKMNWGDC